MSISTSLATTQNDRSHKTERASGIVSTSTVKITWYSYSIERHRGRPRGATAVDDVVKSDWLTAVWVHCTAPQRTGALQRGAAHRLIVVSIPCSDARHPDRPSVCPSSRVLVGFSRWSPPLSWRPGCVSPRDGCPDDATTAASWFSCTRHLTFHRIKLWHPITTFTRNTVPETTLLMEIRLRVKF